MRAYTVKNFALDEATLRVQETLFHNANGLVGVRGTLEEGVPRGWNTMRGTYLNGVYDIVPMKQAEPLCNLPESKEAMLNIADTQGIELFFDGERFSLFEGKVEAIERTLDMDAGTTTRKVLWVAPSGSRLQITFTRMASFVQLPLFTIDCTITALAFDGQLEIVSKHTGLVQNYADESDPRLAGERRNCLVAESWTQTDTADFLTAHTLQSGLRVCSGVAHDIQADGVQRQRNYEPQSHTVETRLTCAVHSGQTVHLVKYAVFTDSVRCQDCAAAAQNELAAAVGHMDELYCGQHAYLAAFWSRAELAVQGDDENALAICFNQYQLLQAAGKDGQCSVAAKGLSGEGYEGHYFWDTEMYILPFFIFTDPALAKKLLHFRYATLGAARENAKLLGHRAGALYPWRTIAGRECSGYFPSGTAQYHIDGDIAHAVMLYWLTTGDDDYLVREGTEILLETARLWLDVGCWYNGSFRINDVTGPDEYTCMVNNNYYTNACAKANLQAACEAACLLRSLGRADVLAKLQFTPQEEAAFAKAAECMYLPYDAEKGINPQDDSFLQKPVWDIAATPKENFPLLLHYHPLHLYRYQVCKQADTVMAYFVFEELQSEEVMRRSFEYYEKITTHDSSLSNCIFSIVAARLGLHEKAWQYFGDSAQADLRNAHGNTKDGLHTANMGGCYLAIVCGFAGLRVRRDGLYLRPFLPDGWQGYRFCVRYHGSLVCVEVTQDGCNFSLLQGGPAPIHCAGQSVVLQAEKQIHFTTEMLQKEGSTR